MNTRMASILAILLLAAVVVAPSFAGGSGEGTVSPESIRFAVAMDPARLAYYEDSVEIFNSRETGYSVVLENTPWSEYWQKLQTLTAGGTMPDVWNYVPGFGQEWLENGRLLPIDDYVEASGMDLSDFAEGMLDFMRYDGELHGLPYDVSGHVLFFNKDLFDLAGVDYPTEEWTFDDLEEAARAIVAAVPQHNGGKVYGLGNYMGHDWVSAGYYKSFGGDFVTSDLEVMIDSEGSKAALEYFADLGREGLAPPEFGDASGGQFIQWLTGRAGMVLDGPWAIPTYQETVAFEMDIVPVPAGPACRCPSLLGGTFVIDAATDWPEQSFEFLSFITSEKQLETNVAASGAGIPGRASAFDEMDPMMQKAADYIMEVNQAFYPIQGSFAIFSKQQSEFELVFTGEKSVEAALGAAADYAREVIEENYE